MAQMRSRREQVDAHRFITSRMNQALVLANPDSVERPLRRIGVSIFASVMIMVLIFGGFAIAALLGKGNDAPMENHIIRERETNAIYVYTRAKDSGELKLWPVENFTSALLLLEGPYGDEPPVQNLKSSSLVGIPRGFKVGIYGAPASPPHPESLLQHEDWNVCSSPREAGGVATHHLAQVVVEDLPEPQRLEPGQWILAETAEGLMYVLWNDLKFEVEEDMLNKLGLNRDNSVTVKQEVLNTITSGDPLSVRIEDGFGTDSETEGPDGTLKYGQVVESGDSKYVLMKHEGADEFSEIGTVSWHILKGEYGESQQVDDGLISTTGVQATYEKRTFPKTTGDLFTFDSTFPAVCAIFDPDAGVDDAHLTLGLYRTAPQTLTDNAKSVELDDDGRIVSNSEETAQVVLPTGSAALVMAQGQPGTNLQGMRFLVDSVGKRYGLKDTTTGTGVTQALLGYAGIDPVGVPNSILALIPQGSVLNPELARQELDPDGELDPYDTGEDEEEAEGDSGE